MGVSDLRSRTLAYLASHNTLTLATVGPDGPWAAGLFYVNDDFALYWLSDPMARHSRNIAHDPRVSVTDWRVIQGLQMEGTAEQTGRIADGGRPITLYLAKYPFLGRPNTLTATLAAALDAARVYRFTATRILFIDNTKGLGHRQSVEIAGGRSSVR
jgi:uncharacterized protein